MASKINAVLGDHDCPETQVAQVVQFKNLGMYIGVLQRRLQRGAASSEITYD